MSRQLFLGIVKVVVTGCFFSATAEAQPPPYVFQPDKSVARNWSEALIFALRRDTGRVPYNARVAFQFSVAVYDAWAFYDDDSKPYLLGQNVNGFECPMLPTVRVGRSPEAQKIAISFAAYRYLRHRFRNSNGALASFAVFDEVMARYGLNPDYISMAHDGGNSPAALGNYIADCVIRFAFADGSNEADGYRTRFYQPVNPPLDPTNPRSIDNVIDPDRWQKLEVAGFVSKTGFQIPAPDFETPEWGRTTPFAMGAAERNEYERDGGRYLVYHDPGPPPMISLTNPGSWPEEYIWGHSLVAVWSGHLDPSRGHGAEQVDISPGAIGNNQYFPDTYPGLHDFYDFLGSDIPGDGHPVNPVTGEPYTPQIVPFGDYVRVLVNWWADGPFTAETPAGSMMHILNTEVSDSPFLEKRIGGAGPVVDDLEWDAKAYFALSAAIHEAGVTTWSLKGWYDYARPITAIRWMGTIGQSSDPADPDCNYHPQGIKYVDDPSDPAGDGSNRVIDCVRPGDPLADDPATPQPNDNVGKIKIFAWRAHGFVSNPNFDVAGVDWILAEDWWPYQRGNFVTPPFAGFTSGHATMTSAGAQALTLLTGDPFFPSGLYEYHTDANEFLDYEDGPSVDITLQFATYFDLSDSAAISRLWAGVHPPADDVPGRRIGRVIGVQTWNKASSYFSGKERVAASGGGSFGILELLTLASLLSWQGYRCSRGRAFAGGAIRRRPSRRPD
jgi:hypothetical protein